MVIELDLRFYTMSLPTTERYTLFLPPKSEIVVQTINVLSQQFNMVDIAARWNDGQDTMSVLTDQKLFTETFWSTYLSVLFSSYLSIKEPSKNIVVRQLTPEAPPDIAKAVGMKPRDFFATRTAMVNSAVQRMRANVDANGRLLRREALLVLSLIQYVRQRNEFAYFSSTPRDFLLELIPGGETIAEIHVLAYAVYDVLYTYMTQVQLKEGKAVRQVVVPKEKPRRRERRLFVTVCKDGAVTFDSPVITDHVLTLIEKSVIRCGAIAKLFLVTADHSVFYKYCLIRGKVCLKRVQDKATIRI